MGVPFVGVPVGTYDFGTGPVFVGVTDTIVHRTQDAVGVPQVLPGPADATIPIEMVALGLVSAVQVDFGAGTGFYYVTLQSARGGTASTGTMTIHFNDDHVGLTADECPGTGTFDSTLDVFFDLRFGALDGLIVMSDLCPMNSDPDVYWDHTGGALLIDDVNYLLREDGPGVNPHQDFFAGDDGGGFAENGPSATHIVADVPEPATLLLLTLGGLAVLRRRSGLALRRWKSA
jgi:hypothetical protein